MTKGDQYVLKDGTRIEVKRVASDHSWADIKVTQRSGASWSKRQPLRDGELPFEDRINLSIWEGDGLPDTYEEWASLTNRLGMVLPEISEWLVACKREAWVHEKSARYDDDSERDRNIAIARYFWRRTERLNGYMKLMKEELDKDIEQAP